ncbi:hypothetical protein H6G04_33990 [Calothrix membranacea FACHB-236]|nr:hypothetical protein [Calothrix membranacea FACHB-236]
MSSILSQILQHENFIEEVKDLIQNKVIDMDGIGYDSLDGSIEGTVSDYVVLSEIEFKNVTGDSLEWSFDFELTGEATISYLNSDGSDGESEVLGLCKGTVKVTLPDDTLTIDNIENIITNLELDIYIDAVALDASDDDVVVDLDSDY